MVYCSVPFCKSESGKCKGISFHEYPTDETLREKWLKGVSRQGENSSTPWMPGERSTVCSEHFLPSDFKPGLKIKKLIAGAVPSVFIGYPSYKRPKQKPGRRRIVKVQPQTTTRTRKRLRVPSPETCQSPILDNQQPLQDDVESSCGVHSLDVDRGPESVATSSVSVATSSVSVATSSVSVATSSVSVATSSVSVATSSVSVATSSVSVATSSGSVATSSGSLATSSGSVATSSVSVATSTESVASSQCNADAAVQTKLTFTHFKERVQQIKNLQRMCRRLRKSNAVLKDEMEILRAENRSFKDKHLKYNIDELEEGSRNGDTKAEFLEEQLRIYNMKTPHWTNKTIKYCVLWHSKSPTSYRFMRGAGVLRLPSRSTLKRYDSTEAATVQSA